MTVLTVLNTIFYALVIPVLVYVIVRRLDRRYAVQGNTALLLTACAVFTLAVFVPSPKIDGQDTQFFTHVLGGAFVVMIWLYFKPVTKKYPWYWEIFLLFALVSALGTLNELYELFAHQMGVIRVPLNDTSWDLLANTVGFAAFYGLYQMKKAAQRLFIST